MNLIATSKLLQVFSSFVLSSSFPGNYFMWGVIFILDSDKIPLTAHIPTPLEPSHIPDIFNPYYLQDTTTPQISCRILCSIWSPFNEKDHTVMSYSI